MNWISPIAIDLGAKNTGVFMTQYQTSQNIENGLHQSLVVSMPDKGLQLSMVGRRTARHAKRNAKRRKLAKRLMALIGEKELKITEFNRPDLQILWSNLMNRRGYTFLGSEGDGEEISFLMDDGQFLFDEDFSEFSHLGETIEIILSKIQPDHAKNLAEKVQIIRKQIKEKSYPWDPFTPKDIQKDYGKALDSLQKTLDPIIRASETGHYHRRETFQNLKDDFFGLTEFEPLRQIVSESLPLDNFLNLICHINNLQLRVLRKYFNDKSYQNGDQWDSQRFHKVFLRWVQSWHCDDRERVRKQQILTALKTQNTISWFLQSDPELTIPPFEDQNNRRPPKPQTLILNLQNLDQELPEWRQIINAFISSEPEYFKPYRELMNDVCNQLQAKNAAYQKCTPKTKEDWYLGRALQFLMDRNSKHDPYHLRKLTQEKPFREKDTYLKQIYSLLGQTKGDQFLSFAKTYYQESQEAKNGIWLSVNARILSTESINPPRKQTLIHYHVASILGISPNHLENLDLKNSASASLGYTKTHLAAAAKAVKDYGNELKILLDEAQNVPDPKKADPDQKSLLKLIENCEKNAKTIANTIDKDNKFQPDWHKRFSSVFSMAQLHEILEKDRGGFSKTAQISTIDNSIRSRIFLNDQAFASRLASNRVRPFDGVLRRNLEAQATKIAEQKLNQIQNLDGTVRIPILVEQNRFKFSEDLHGIKGKNNKAKDAKKKGEEVKEKLLEQFQDKRSRIAKDGFGLSPYSGSPVGPDSGEIDHIIPRAESLKQYGFVLNSEANLILCTGKDNGYKTNLYKTLDDLSSTYLSAVFGHSNKNRIREEIAEFMPTLQKQSLVDFHRFSQRERNLIRHALFDNELREQVIRLLAQQFKARVNGTQNYLAQRIMEKILASPAAKNLKLEFSYHEISSQAVSELRHDLSRKNESLKKPENQPLYSHVVDAQLVMLSGLQLTKELEQNTPPFFIEEQIRCLEKFNSSVVEIEDMQAKAKLQRKRPQSAPLFKAGMYAERYIPLIALKSGEFGIGFHPKNYMPLDEDKETSNKKMQAIMGVLGEFLYAANSPVSSFQTLLKLLNSTNDSFVCLNIKKEKLHDALLQNDNQKLEALSSCLRYFTQKVSPMGQLTLNNKPNPKWKDNILKGCEQKFEIKFKSILGIKGDLKTTIKLPILKEWEKILNDTDLNSKTTIQEISDYLNQQLPEWFPSPNERKHQLKRKIYSLPLTANPSGGFRIQRSGWNQQNNHQVMVVEGSCKSGTDSSGKDVYHPAYLGKRVKPLDYEISRNSVHIRSGVSLACDIPGAVKEQILAFSLEKAGTRYWVELEMPEGIFLDELRLHSNGEHSYASSLDLPPNLKVKGWLKPVLDQGVFGKPDESAIRFQKIGAIVRFRYRSGGAVVMNKALEQAVATLEKS